VTQISPSGTGVIPTPPPDARIPTTDVTTSHTPARARILLVRRRTRVGKRGGLVLQQRLCATVEGDDDQAPSLTVGVTLLAEHHFRQPLQFGMSHSHRIAVTPTRAPLHCRDAAIAVIFSS
jgi:hypothetical protein